MFITDIIIAIEDVGKRAYNRRSSKEIWKTKKVEFDPGLFEWRKNQNYLRKIRVQKYTKNGLSLREYKALNKDSFICSIGAHRSIFKRLKDFFRGF